MDMAAEFRHFGKTDNERGGNILGMGGGKAYSLDSLNLRHNLEKSRKIGLSTALQSVGVYILPKQGNLLQSHPGHLRDFTEYIGRAAADFPAAHIRDYAVGAEVVATLHNGNESRDPTGLVSIRKEVEPRFAVDEIYFGQPLPFFCPPDHLGQLVQVVGPEHHVQVGDLLQKPRPFLLGDTSPHSQNQSSVSTLQPLEIHQACVHLLLRLFPDAAGIEHDEVGTGGIPGGLITRFPEQSDDLLRIADIHLAAEGLD